MRHYLFRVVDRGTVDGVPVVDCYLLARDGAAESCLMHTIALRPSPKTVEELAEAFGELGVRVERQKRPLPNAA